MTAPETTTPPDATPRRPRGRVVGIVLAVVLALGGLSLIGYAVADQEQPPAPTPAAQGVIEPVPVAPPSTADAGLPASAPTSISIPAIDVTSPINQVGLNPDRTLEVPAPGPLYDQAAWYRASVTPGQVGPSVILGHIDSAKNGPSVFFDLAALQPGGSFTVGRADGSELAFRIDGVRSYPKDAFPTETVYGPTTRPEVRLITCGGSFDSSARSYRDNTVVFAHLLGEVQPPAGS